MYDADLKTTADFGKDEACEFPGGYTASRATRLSPMVNSFSASSRLRTTQVVRSKHGWLRWETFCSTSTCLFDETPRSTTCALRSRQRPRHASYPRGGGVWESDRKQDLIAAYPQVVLGGNIKHYIVIPECLRRVKPLEERAMFEGLRRPSV